MIDVKGLTLTYPGGKGVFDLDFSVKEGEVMGYLGPNGAGKTTTIRALLGFMKPDKGVCSIQKMDCFEKASVIQKDLGYIPGEIAFIEGMDGAEYLKFITDMRGAKDTAYQKELLDMFELAPKGKIRKYSKGMKQKLGIVAAFMHNPQILILDEPTSGLDPLMQNRFIDLILSEKKKGKTILMSSHMFEEVERTCDNVLIIKDGKIIKQADIVAMTNTKRKGFVIKTPDAAQTAQLFKQEGFLLGTVQGNELEVYVTGDNIDKFGKMFGKFTLLGLDSKVQSLEDVFMDYYAKEEK